MKTHLFIILFVLAFLNSCKEKKEDTANTSVFKEINDPTGRKITIPEKPERVLGLASSMTEILFSVVSHKKIVARTQTCNYPEAAKALPVVNTYPLDLESLKMADPDVVFAVEGITSYADAERIQELGIPVYFQRYLNCEDILNVIREVGNICGDSLKAANVADSLAQELKKISNSEKPAKNLSVLFLINNDPIYVHGYHSLMTDKISRVGGHNVMPSDMKGLSPEITREFILKLNPDIIIGENWNNMDQDFFGRYPELKMLNCYKTKNFFTSSQDLQSRPGPRVVESIKELRTILLKAKLE